MPVGSPIFILIATHLQLHLAITKMIPVTWPPATISGAGKATVGPKSSSNCGGTAVTSKPAAIDAAGLFRGRLLAPPCRETGGFDHPQGTHCGQIESLKG